MKVFLTAVIACAATLAIVALVWVGLRRSSKEDRGAAVRVEAPARGDVVEVVSASGMIEAKTKVSISARVSALIEEIPYREGQKVTKGDPNATPPAPPSVLVRLDDKELQAALRSARSRLAAQSAMIDVAKARLMVQRAAIDGIRVSLQDAQRAFERNRELHKGRLVSQEAYESAQCLVEKLQADQVGLEATLKADETNLVVMQHELAATEAEVTRCKDNLSYTVITSPIDGIVIRVKAAVGEMALMGTMNNPGTEILQVADLSNMLVVAEVDEAYIGKIQPAQKAKVRIQAYGSRTFDGTVDSVALTHSIAQRTGAKYFEVRILLDPAGQRLLSGMTGDAEIETQRHTGVLRIPSQAVVSRRSDELPATVRDDNPNVLSGKTEVPAVYRLREGKAVVTPVRIGVCDATSTEVEAGLTAEDSVIVGPFKVLEQLRHDQPVHDDRLDAKPKPGKGEPAAKVAASASGKTERP
jgi:HlyD family secretion protein